MEEVARIVLAVDSEHLAQDVIDFLDRTGRTLVVDTVRDAQALAAVVDRERPDAVVGSPGVVRAAGPLNGSAFLAVATEESVRALRDAVDSGAAGFFVWPADRRALGSAAARTAHPEASRTRRARVVAVCGSRGGAGVTFVASHLAAAFTRRGAETAVIDAGGGDLSWALGAPMHEGVRTLADLSPLEDEVSEEHVRNVLWTHATGVRALLASEREDAPPRIEGVVDAATRVCDVLIVHAPERSLASSADLTLIVVTLDVFSFRAARRDVDALEGSARWEIVVNRATRGRVVASDVERVFGRPALAVLPTDRRVPQAQDRGELLPARGRMGRAFGRLAARIEQELAA